MKKEAVTQPCDIEYAVNAIEELSNAKRESSRKDLKVKGDW